MVSALAVGVGAVIGVSAAIYLPNWVMPALAVAVVIAVTVRKVLSRGRLGDQVS